jgi:hypothetical protein
MSCVPENCTPSEVATGCRSFSSTFADQPVRFGQSAQVTAAGVVEAWAGCAVAASQSAPAMERMTAMTATR